MSPGNDAATVQQLFAEGLGIENMNVIETIRLGKVTNTSGPRPLLIKLETVEDKWTILKNAKNLAKAKEDMRAVSIVPDMTKDEREANKHMRQELKRRRENGEDLIIRRGQIMERDAGKK